MNSSNGTQKSGVSKETPTSSQISNADSNANLSLTTNESKGAIPKTKLTKPIPKKSNNNIEELSMFNSDVLKRNGFSKTPATTSNYLNNTYPEPNQEGEQLKSSKDSHRSNSGFSRTSLNIPVDLEFLNRTYTSLDNPISIDVAPLDPTNASSYQEQNTKDDSSSDDNELLSVSDDGCIYTYKGDHVADLPSSFFNLEAIQLEDAPADSRDENNSSPEMDFLEMDFDPGPSGDADSDSISNAEIDNAASLPLDSKTNIEEEPKPCCSKDLNNDIIPPESNNVNKQDNITKGKYLNYAKVIPEPVKDNTNTIKIDIKMPWSCSVSERTRTAKTLRMIKRHHSSRGDLISPSESGLNSDVNAANLSLFHNLTKKNCIRDKNTFSNIENSMIWTSEEACLKQITQVGPSACGATAVINVLNALRFPIPTLEKVNECVSTKLRANFSPLTEYLQSRSVAGCSHRDLISGLYKLSNRRIYSRFFAMYPERLVNLRSWLGYWIQNGAVPIATLNLQKCEGNIPDSWHHQMIFGVGPEGIYLTNPLECVDPDQLWPQLSSESVLSIRTEDVMSRWNAKVDLPQLMRISDIRWRELNVVGQVAKVVRESRKKSRMDCVFTSHIRIPVEYKAGITLALDMDSPAFSLLRQCPELPLLQPEYAASAL